MLQDDILNGRRQVYLLLSWPPISQVSIESRPAHLRQLAHSLDTQTTLQWHLRSYFVVDTSPPEANLCRRRALTRCKARLKKSTSIVLFANTRLRARICLRNMNSCERPVVKQVAYYPDLEREPRDVVASDHSFNCILLKLPAVSLTLFSLHFELLSRRGSNTELSLSRGSLHWPKMRENGFWNPRKCFTMNVTRTVGV
jgi:hypothetical protein